MLGRLGRDNKTQPISLTITYDSSSSQDNFYLSSLAQYDTAWNYYLPDRLGSTRQLVDPTGTLVLGQTFDPFGNVLAQAGAGQSVFGYTGEQTDPAGLVFLRARYYDPAMGRFLTADSVVPDPLSSVGWNRYAYVANNPIRYIDPSGHTLEAPVSPFCLFGKDPETGHCKPDPFFGFATTTWQTPTINPGQAALMGGLLLAYYGMRIGQSINMPTGSPGFSLLSEGENTQLVTIPDDIQQCFDPSFEARLPNPGRRLPGGPPIPSKRIPKSDAGMAPSGPPLPGPEPPGLDPKEELKKLMEALEDPNIPPEQKVLIASMVSIRLFAAITGIARGLP